jgi:hypothetical protein
MFHTARAKASKRAWRAVLIGATVPIAMLAAAPAVGAADIDRAETVTSEQLPPAPPAPGVPDPAALSELLTCVADLFAAALDTQAPPAPPPAPMPPGEAEQLPPLPPPPGGQPPAPDIATLTAQCQDLLALLQPPTPPAPPAPAAALPQE